MSSRKQDYRYVIVGGGIAGMSAARAIRERDSDGPLLLVSSEARLPYKRTKISKNIAAGFSRDAFAMEEDEWYRDNRVDLLLGESVVSIDAASHRAVFGKGEETRWERLILATGASPVLPSQLPPDGSGFHVVRTAEDVEGLREAAQSARRVVVVGNGVLAVEVAEQLRLLEKEVLLVGSGSRLLARHLNEELSSMLENLLGEHGVEMVTNERVFSVQQLAGGALLTSARRSIDSSPSGRATGAEGRNVATKHGSSRSTTTSDVEAWEGDLVVFCAGVRSNVALARASGLAVSRGVLVDEQLRASRPDVYAAGDVAEHPGGYISFLWHAAELQGRIAGENATGDTIRHSCPPFRLKCEVFGNYFFSMNPLADEEGIEVVNEHEGSRYRCLAYRGGNLTSVQMANEKERAKSYVTAVREGWSRARVSEQLPWRF